MDTSGHYGTVEPQVTGRARSRPRPPETSPAPGSNPHPRCRGPAALANEAGVARVEPHPAVELVPTLPGSTNVVLAGRATTVPFTAVLTGPERTATDNAIATLTCAVRYLRR